ncbi:MAG: NAD-dependent epimerase/dehydratase family protein [Promethearchaeota archaeon]
MAKILITGGTGFIGISLVKKLYDLGHEITLLKREKSDLSPFKELSKIKYINGDVRDIESIKNAIEGIEIIYHLAAYTGIWARKKSIYHDINVKGTENVATIALEKDIPLLYVSSFTALGPTPPEPVDETHENTHFYMEYERSKHQAKKLIKNFIPKGLKVLIFYPGIVFGPGDFNLFGRMLFDVMRGKILPLGICPGKGESMACFSYVKDISNILVQSLERNDLYGEDFILGGENIKFKEYLDLIADISRGKKAKKLPFWITVVYAWLLEVVAFFTKKPPYLTRPTLRSIKYHRAYSSKKAIDQLGYKITPLKEALEETIKWYKDYNKKEK